MSENQFKPIFNDMQSSVYFKKFPPVSDEHVKTSTRLMQPEKDYKSFYAFSGYPPNMTSKTLLRHLKTTYRYCRQRQVVIKMLTIWK